MTPAEVKVELVALKQEMGPKADIFASIELRYSKPIAISGYPEGVCKSAAFRVEGHEWREAIDLAKAAWAESTERFHLRMVAELALEIIRLTSELGACTAAALRGDKWSSDDIKRWGGAACTKANEMASNGPFVIKPAAIANAA